MPFKCHCFLLKEILIFPFPLQASREIYWRLTWAWSTDCSEISKQHQRDNMFVLVYSLTSWLWTKTESAVPLAQRLVLAEVPFSIGTSTKLAKPWKARRKLQASIHDSIREEVEGQGRPQYYCVQAAVFKLHIPLSRSTFLLLRVLLPASTHIVITYQSATATVPSPSLLDRQFTQRIACYMISDSARCWYTVVVLRPTASILPYWLVLMTQSALCIVLYPLPATL